MASNEEERETYIIPQNYEDNLVTSTGISYRNIIEGVIILGIFVLLFWFLPLSLKIRIILIAVFGGGFGIFGVVGIHHCSLSEYAMLVIHYKMSDNHIHRSDMFDHIEENNETNNEIEEERGSEDAESGKKRRKKR